MNCAAPEKPIMIQPRKKRGFLLASSLSDVRVLAGEVFVLKVTVQKVVRRVIENAAS